MDDRLQVLENRTVELIERLRRVEAKIDVLFEALKQSDRRDEAVRIRERAKQHL